MPRLFHVSDDMFIEDFQPRVPPLGGEPVVWAVDEEHLANYLLPRDCPRVTFCARPDSAPDDVARLLGPTFPKRVVAIESGWLWNAMFGELHVYELPPDTFDCIDAGAGYYTSKAVVQYLDHQWLRHPLRELVATGAELRVVPSLWPLRDAVLASSLQFSFIRMRNAAPREAADS
jgi:hypothetical protein